MSIVFEKTEKYDGIPEDQRKIAETYLLGKKFRSLHQALRQIHGDHTLEWYGFSVGEVKVNPRYIPYILHEAPINVRFPSGAVDATSLNTVTGLVAKVEE